MSRKLLPYQTDCLTKLSAARPNKKGLIVMASGLGKTFIAAHDVKNFLAQLPLAKAQPKPTSEIPQSTEQPQPTLKTPRPSPENPQSAPEPTPRLLYLCHNVDILIHAQREFQEVFGSKYTSALDYKARTAPKEPTNRKAQSVSKNPTGDTAQVVPEKPTFHFATVQKVYRHLQDFQPDEFAYIIFDECHHAKAHTYEQVIQYFRPKFLLGLTATPRRLDGQDIEEIFGPQLVSLDLPEALADSLLTPVDYRLMLDDLNDEELEQVLKENAAHYTVKELNRRFFIPKRDQETIKSIAREIRSVKDPKIIIFCRTINHAQAIAKFLPEGKIVHSHMSRKRCSKHLDDFRSGKINLLISIDMLNEGVDFPAANVVVFLRSTVSQIVFYQQLGRGLRLSPGKDKVLVLDYVANCERLEMIEQLQVSARLHTGGARTHADPFAVTIGTHQFQGRLVDILSVIKRARSLNLQPTREELLADIRRLKTEFGHTPTMNDIKDHSFYSPAAYSREFGSHNAAIIAAGFKPNAGQYTEDQMRTYLDYLAKTYGEPIAPKTIKSDDSPLKIPIGYYRNSYGTWHKALEYFGHQSAHQEAKFETQSELLDLLKKKRKELGHIPSTRELITDKNMPNPVKYRKAFGSFVAAKKLAFPDYASKKPPIIFRYQETTDEGRRQEAIGYIQSLAAELGHTPRMTDFDRRQSYPSSRSITNLFHGYNNAIKAAGFIPNQEYFTREEAIELLQDLAKNLGHTPTAKELVDYRRTHKNTRLPSDTFYTDTFGTWNNALTIAGLPLNRKL